MSITYRLIPYGWRCTLEECPPGNFMWGNIEDNTMGFGFKSEYKREGPLGDSQASMIPEAFNAAGEYLSIDVDSVQPLIGVFEDE